MNRRFGFNSTFRASEAGGEAAEGLRKMEALSSELEAKTGQLAAATEDLEVGHGKIMLRYGGWRWWG